MWEGIQYFKPEEFKCSCCGEEHMNLHFVKLLDETRRKLGFPLKISSGYRCPDYNEKVSSGRDGPHTTGKAADIHIYYGDARLLLDEVMDVFEGIGINQKGPVEGRFIHLDLCGLRVWSY
ncbi:MAG: D-Ala-D-Ala carboxypeptidase family metallohydrolase [bacterium]